MRVFTTAALAGAYLFIAPVFTTIGAEMPSVAKPNETVVFKTTADGTWPFKGNSEPIVYFNI